MASVGDVEAVMCSPNVRFDSLELNSPSAVIEKAFVDVDALRFFLPHGEWVFIRKRSCVQLTLSLPVLFETVKLKRMYISVRGRRLSTSGPGFQIFRLGSILIGSYWFRMSVAFLRSENVDSRTVMTLLNRAAAVVADRDTLIGSDFLVSMRPRLLSAERQFVPVPPANVRAFLAAFQQECAAYHERCWVCTFLPCAGLCSN